jgi:hypothetical protein
MIIEKLYHVLIYVSYASPADPAHGLGLEKTTEEMITSPPGSGIGLGCDARLTRGVTEIRGNDHLTPRIRRQAWP